MVLKKTNNKTKQKPILNLTPKSKITKIIFLVIIFVTFSIITSSILLWLVNRTEISNIRNIKLNNDEKIITLIMFLFNSFLTFLLFICSIVLLDLGRKNTNQPIKILGICIIISAIAIAILSFFFFSQGILVVQIITYSFFLLGSIGWIYQSHFSKKK